LVEEDEEVTVELRSFSAILWVASSDGDGTWPVLGFVVCLQRRTREKELGVKAYPHWRWSTL
jgi:hypothetical protein